MSIYYLHKIDAIYLCNIIQYIYVKPIDYLRK
nr:MAG TPA: hypothetical protein [Caudoviricetes sp.]